MSSIDKTQIDADGIGHILYDKFLAVPAYQRSYSWEKDNVEDFIVDIVNAFQEKEPEYFLGTIVLIDNDGARLEIVDGQQRLATTSLIIGVIRDFLKKGGDGKRAEEIERKYLFTIDFETMQKTQKVELNSTDNQHFAKLLNNTDEKADKTDSHSIRALSSAADNIRSHINSLSQNDPNINETLVKMLKYIETSVKVIVITVTSTANAFSIFETLNDRGLALSVADLLKNYLFGKTKSHINESIDHWSQIVATLNTVGDETMLPKLIRHYWVSAYGVTTERALFNTIKKRIQLEADATTLIEQLSDAAKDYAALQNPKHPRWVKLGQATEEAVRGLDTLPLDQTTPLLLSISRKFSDNELSKTLKKMVPWTVRMLVAGNTRSSQFSERLSKISIDVDQGTIKTQKKLYAALRAAQILPTNDVFRKEFTQITPKPALARYYLSELEKAKRTSEGKTGLTPSPSPDDVNLEHILPQTVSDFSEWPAFDIDSAREYRGRLGNLAILDVADNSGSGNDPFDEKKRIYSKSPFLTTSSISAIISWNKNSIDNRQIEQADLACKAWPLE